MEVRLLSVLTRLSVMVLNSFTSIITSVEVWDVIQNKGVIWMQAEIAFYALGATNLCMSDN